MLSTPTIPPPIETKDQGLRWALETVSEAEAARAACDVPLIARSRTTAVELRRREQALLVRHGAALGTLTALFRCNMIEADAYNQLVLRVRATLIPGL